MVKIDVRRVKDRHAMKPEANAYWEGRRRLRGARSQKHQRRSWFYRRRVRLVPKHATVLHFDELPHDLPARYSPHGTSGPETSLSGHLDLRAPILAVARQFDARCSASSYTRNKQKAGESGYGPLHERGRTSPFHGFRFKMPGDWFFLPPRGPKVV